MSIIVGKSSHQGAACSSKLSNQELEAACSCHSGPRSIEKGMPTLTFLYYSFYSAWLWDGWHTPCPKFMAGLLLFTLVIPSWNCLHRHYQKCITLTPEEFPNMINLAIKISHYTRMLTQLFFYLGSMGLFFLNELMLIGRNQFLVVVGLWTLFSRWLSVRGSLSI